jgi:CheY-like chemotaxis protein
VTPTSPETVLIVDDTPANLGVVVEHLEEHGFRVVVAQGGEEALLRAARVRPDLILLDVMMPGIDGFETCRRLKATEVTRSIPVIFMSALSGATTRSRASMRAPSTTSPSRWISPRSWCASGRISHCARCSSGSRR